MKSNDEFIAGIYEKAAVYTEEKETKVINVNFAAKALRTAAMVVLCLGLAGVGVMTLDGKNGQIQEENYGITLTAETEEQGMAMAGAAQLRIGPEAEFVTFTGVVKEVSAEDNRIWLTLLFDEDAPMWVEGSEVCIRWDMLEPISEEITAGVTLKAYGALSEYNGYAELVLTDCLNLEMK